MDRAPDPSPERGTAPTATDRIEHGLANAAKPLNLRQLRHLCRLRMATLCDVLTTLRTEGRVLKAADGYRLAPR